MQMQRPCGGMRVRVAGVTEWAGRQNQGGQPGQTGASSATVRGLNFSLRLEAPAASSRRETGTTDSCFK